jgi:thiol-disulfide isomerase/thioredoxin
MPSRPVPSAPSAIASFPVIPALLAAALVYTAATAPANAQDLTPDTRVELSEMREGDMRKLNLHAQARPAGDEAFADRAGAEHTLAATDGKVRLVNFWATWCAPCRFEKPALDALAADLSGPDFEVIAIATGRHDLEAIDAFNADVGVEHLATYIDETNRLAVAMGVPGLPVTVLLNREGREIGRLMGGADWDSPSARAIIERVIALGR